MRLALVLVAALLLGGCSDGGSDDPEAPVPSTSTSAPESATASPAAAPQAPKNRACYRLDYTEAVAPTVDAASTPCERPHTSMTFAVGPLDAVVDGHLLAVDSDRVQQQVATACPKALTSYVGGSVKSLRLSMIRPVWFTPTVEDSDAGADWYRCDAVVLAGTSSLAEVKAGLRGALDKPATRDRYAMCGTAAPDDKKFERVLCSAKHSWRAIDVVVFPEGAYPGEKKVRAAGRTQCEDAGADVAEDPLTFEWGYEWPTKEQWGMGQAFGRCWAPD